MAYLYLIGTTKETLEANLLEVAAFTDEQLLDLTTRTTKGVCPACKSITFASRKVKLPVHRCDCGCEFETPLQVTFYVEPKSVSPTVAAERHRAYLLRVISERLNRLVLRQYYGSLLK